MKIQWNHDEITINTSPVRFSTRHRTEGRPGPHTGPVRFSTRHRTEGRTRGTTPVRCDFQLATGLKGELGGQHQSVAILNSPPDSRANLGAGGATGRDPSVALRSGAGGSVAEKPPENIFLPRDPAGRRSSPHAPTQLRSHARTNETNPISRLDSPPNLRFSSFANATDP